LLLDTADSVVTAEGSVNFPSETLFVTLSPHNKNFTPMAVRVPVDLHSTFADPIYNFSPWRADAPAGRSAGLRRAVGAGGIGSTSGWARTMPAARVSRRRRARRMTKNRKASPGAEGPAVQSGVPDEWFL
jgi:hypothetical protein